MNTLDEPTGESPDTGNGSGPSRQTGRRTALTAGLTTAALFAVSRSNTVDAADLDPVLLGTPNSATTSTTVVANVSGGGALLCQNSATVGLAIIGESLTATGFGVGVYGTTVSPGGRGVYGVADAETGTGIGVRGHSWSPTGRGILGGAPATGNGIIGYVGVAEPTVRPGVGVHGSSLAGTGVRGDSDTGTAVVAFTPSVAGTRTGVAIAAWGRVRLVNCAGVASIGIGGSSVTITPGIDLLTTSSVVATLQGSAGGNTTVKYVAVNATTNTLTIFLTAASTAPVNVAWHVFG